MITQAAGRLYYYNLYRYRSYECGWRAICLIHIEARRRDILARHAPGMNTTWPITFKFGIYRIQPSGLRAAFAQRPARWRSSGAPKTLAFLRAAEFGWARVSERWPQPRRAFCLLNRSIDFNVHQCFWCFTILFPNGKKRDERVCGRNPRSDQRERRSAYAPVVRWPPRAVWKNNSALILFSSLADMI